MNLISPFFCPQTLTPHNKGLIKRAISQSGTALCPWAINENPRRFAEEVHYSFSTCFICLMGLFFYISSWRLNVYMGNDNLNPVHRLLWRSTAPLIKIWLPVWRWLILCCLQWLAVSVCPAHPIVRTALHTAISLFTFDSLHVDFRHCVRALYQS